jgi:hypothetical protein
MSNGPTKRLNVSVRSGITASDRADLTELIDQVRAMLAAMAGDDIDTARGKLDDLEEAIASHEPDLATMEHVHGWFARKIPTLATAIGRIILSPIVTRMVASAGDDVAAEFDRRFGPSK